MPAYEAFRAWRARWGCGTSLASLQASVRACAAESLACRSARRGEEYPAAEIDAILVGVGEVVPGEAVDELSRIMRSVYDEARRA